MAAMAVKEESLHHATGNLILTSPRKFYAAKINTTHWQLRTLVTSPEQNILYFPSGSDISSINTKTRERELVASLSFKPMCLAASKDWLCCAGNHGDYTAISLKKRSTDFNTLSFLDADADTRLPLDLDPTRRSTTAETNATLRRLRERAGVETTKVGTDIVNCVTIWTPGEDAADCAYKVPVVVVSSNDLSVSLLNVATSEVLQKFILPDFPNRSAISPDGSTLLTICDDPFLYIHERKHIPAPKKERFDVKPGPVYEWIQTGKIQLKSQHIIDGSSMRGSFALSFSKSGKYVAVATQYGVISVFEMECLAEANPSVVSFTSSRPGKEEGAVRAMEFCPGPFDLLAWTEQSGRVGVADVRSLFHSRQTLKLNASNENVERVFISDNVAQRLPESRLRSRTETPDYLGLDAERRQLRNLTRQMLDRHHNPPTTEELEVLQAHRVAREQRDAVRDAAADARRAELAEAADVPSGWGPPAGLNWAPAELYDSIGQSRRAATAAAAHEDTPERAQSTAATVLRDFTNPGRTAASFRAFINERNQESADRRIEARQLQLQARQEPRRRSSMLLSNAGTVVDRFHERNAARTASPRDDGESSSGLERLTLTTSRRDTPRTQPATSSSSSTSWAEIEALYRSRFPGEDILDRTTRVRVEVEEDEPRDFADRLRQPWRPDEAGILIGPRDGGALLDSAVRASETMGVCWSPDGRILYVATVEGIHEYHVDINARKRFPSLVMR